MRNHVLKSVKIAHNIDSEWTVARGAQLMKHTLDLTSIPSLFTLGIVIDNEPYKKSLHGKFALDARGKKIDDIVLLDYWFSTNKSKTYVVQDTIKWVSDRVSFLLALRCCLR